MSAVMDVPKTLEDLRAPDQAFPHSVLVGCDNALVLFAAGFYGRQDAFWIADAGLVATCVDLDEEKLDAMRRIYPGTWEFVAADVHDFARSNERRWDVVTLDPWTNQFTEAADNIDAWCRLARHAVILGTGVNTSVTAPAGWRISGMRCRSGYDGGVYWTILERV